MNRQTTLRGPLLSLLAAAALVGCGGSSGGGVPSTNADLMALTVSAGTLTPAFDVNTTAYAVGPEGLLGAGSVTLTPTAADPNASIAVNGLAVPSGTASQPIVLPFGSTAVQVLVRAVDATSTKAYDVVFTRAAPTMQEAYLKASNTDAADRFALGMALDGDTLVVGAPFEDSNATGVNGNEADNSSGGSGAVYVFTRTGGVWTQQAYLKASNTDPDDRFGHSVAISADTLVVGAYGEGSNATGVNGNQADNSAANGGAAYVFSRTGGVWTQQAYLKASNTEQDDRFGYGVAVSGDTIVVGATGEDSNAIGVGGSPSDNSAAGSGAAYVFTRTGGVWTQQAYLKASNTGVADAFGNFVAISGDTIVSAASGEDSSATGVDGDQTDNGAINSGAAYVFTRTSGAWSQQAYLKASNTDADDVFGFGLVIAGDRIVVGAYREDSNATGVNGNQADNSAVDSGAAYVFARTGGAWAQQAYLKASNAEAGDLFGYSVDSDGDAIGIGAALEASGATGLGGNQADNSAAGSGAAYLFTRTGSTWSQQTYVKASNTGAADSFGASVAVAGGTVAVGAVQEGSSATGVNGNEADNGAGASGAAYVIR